MDQTPAMTHMPKQLLDFRKPHVLRDEKEYNAAVEEIDDLLDREPRDGSEEADRLEFLSLLVEAYEEENYPIPDVVPQDIVDFMLEQKSMTRAQLAEALGGRSRVSEFLNRKRALSGPRRSVLAMSAAPCSICG